MIIRKWQDFRKLVRDPPIQVAYAFKFWEIGKTGSSFDYVDVKYHHLIAWDEDHIRLHSVKEADKTSRNFYWIEFKTTFEAEMKRESILWFTRNSEKVAIVSMRF